MTRVLAAACLVLVGCQWILPLHESDAAGDGGGFGAGGDGGDAALPPGAGAGGDAASPVPDAAPCTAIPPASKAACGACLAALCCASFSACAANAECAAIQTCDESCGFDFNCPGSCNSAHPTGTADFQAELSCAASSCPGACSKVNDGDPCDPSATTTCGSDGVFTCVPSTTDPTKGACRLPCQSTTFCQNNGLAFDLCCLPEGRSTAVCTPKNATGGATCS